MALMDRVKGILLTPKQEWPVIDAEQASVGGLYTSYIIALAAIGPVASIIGSSVVGMRIPFVGTIRLPIADAIRNAVVAYVLGLVAIYVLAIIIDALAPTFGGQRNIVRALKAAAYSFTAWWLAGVLMVIPTLDVLVYLSLLYAAYLLYLGLPVVMKAPQEKAVGYTVVSILVALVLAVVIKSITPGFNRPMSGIPGL